MTDLFSKFDSLIAERQALLDSGVRDPFSLVMEQVVSPTEAIISGKRTILLGTYNYMGMTFDPDVIAAGKKALDEYRSEEHTSELQSLMRISYAVFCLKKKNKQKKNKRYKLRT